MNKLCHISDLSPAQYDAIKHCTVAAAELAKVVKVYQLNTLKICREAYSQPPALSLQ